MFFRSLKYFFLTFVVTILAGIFAVGVKADSMEQYCDGFRDPWFSDMALSGTICEPISPAVTIPLGSGSFNAHMSVRFPDAQTTVEDVTSTVRIPNLGIELGTSQTTNNDQREFKEVPLGDYATRSSRNTRVLEFGSQSVEISYAIRVGLCNASVKVWGESPLDNAGYFSILSDQINNEAKIITKGMKNTKICAIPAPAVNPLNAPTQLPQPSKEEVEKFVREFPPYVPPEDATAPAPASPAPVPQSAAPATATPAAADAQPCTPAELERLKQELAAAEDALQTTNRNLERLAEKLDLINFGIADSEDAIRDYKQAADGAASAQLRKQYEKEVSDYQKRLAQLQSVKAGVPQKLAEAKQAVAAAENNHARLLSELLKCTAAVEKQGIEQAREERKAASEKQHQAFIDEMKKKEKAIEDRLADKEFREAVSDFNIRESQGQTPPDVRAPERRGYFENVCREGEVRQSERKVCHYPQLNENAGPIFRTAYGEAALTRAEIRGFQKVFQALNPSLSTHIALLDAVGPRILPALPIADQLIGLAPDILEGIGKLPELLSGGIAEIRIPVRIDEYEIIDTYTCQADGADWRVPWKKNTTPRFIESRYFEIPFRCGAFKPAPGEEEREFSFEPSGLNRCRAATPDALVRKVG